CIAMSAVFALTLLVISSAPSLSSIAYRAAGIVVGAAAYRQFRRFDVARWRPVLRAWVPWLSIPYVFAVLVASGVPTVEWRSVDEALGAFDARGLLPLWHHYIVSKSQAMVSVVVHLAIYLPIGVLFTLRQAALSPKIGWVAAAAAALSLA